MSLDDFLEQVREEGEEDSEGVFTVAVEQASWKLAEFQLTTPSNFPLHLVACAIDNGASYLHLLQDSKAARHDLCFSFNGSHYTSADLKQLSRPILGGKTPKRLSELAIVLNALSRIGMGVTVFRSYSRDGALGIRVLNGEVRVSEITNDRPPGQYLVVGLNRNNVSLDSWTKACRYAPLEIVVNGSSIREIVDPGVMDGQVRGHYQIDGSEVMMVRRATLSAEPFFKFYREDQTQRSLMLALVPPKVAQEFGLLLIADGRVQAHDRECLHFSGLCGIVCAGDLKRDISQTGFVENETYLQLFQDLAMAIEDFVDKFCASPSALPPSEKSDFKAELAGYYARRVMPESVTAYLEGDSPQFERVKSQPSELQRIGTEALATDQWEALDMARETLRNRANRARELGDYSQTLFQLELEHLLLRTVRREDESLDLIIHFLRYAVSGSGSAKYANITFDFRSPVDLPHFLTSLQRWSPSQLSEKMIRFPVEWTCILEFGMKFTSKQSDWPHDHQGLYYEILGCILLCEAEEATKGVEKFRQLKPKFKQSSIYKAWLDFLKSRYWGRVNFTTYVAIHAELALMNLKTSPTSRRAQKQIRELSKVSDEPNFLVFNQSFGKPEGLAVLVVHFAALANKEPQTAIAFLSRVLVQSWLGLPVQELGLPSERPKNFLMGA